METGQTPGGVPADTRLDASGRGHGSHWAELIGWICSRLAGSLDRHPALWFCGYSAVFWAVSLALAATRPYDFDELSTYYPAALPTARDTWAFFARGLDVHTPVYAVIVHALLRVFGDHHVVPRVPAICGFWLAEAGIFMFAGRRYPWSYAFATMLIAPITSVYFYATDGRPYALVIGLGAMAMVCWQRASEGSSRRPFWLAALACILMLMVSLHYYAVFLWISLAAGEMIRWRARRRPEWGAVLAMAAGLAPIAVFLPMMRLARQNFTSTFWAKPGLGSIENAYRDLLTLGFAPLLGLVVLWIAYPCFSKANSRTESLWNRSIPLHEIVAVTALALLPVYAVPISFLTGIFTSRYVLISILGIALWLGLAACRKAHGDAVLAVMAIGVLGGWYIQKYPALAIRQAASSGLRDHRGPYAKTPWMQTLEGSSLPVVVSPAVFFLPLQHYAPAHVKARLVYLTSLPDALRYDRTDTGDRNLQLFNRRLPLGVSDYTRFVTEHQRFLVCAETTNPTWVIEKLRDQGARMELRRRDGTYLVLDVTMPIGDSHSGHAAALPGL